MAAKRDLYEVLGISKTADEKTIKKAYRKLAKKYHPDMNPGDKTAEQKFKEATDAYNILSDPEKRKLYDQYGHAAFDGTGAESEFYKNYQNYGGAHGGYQEFHFEGGDGDDIFGDIFGSMFGGGRNNKGFHRSSFHQGGFGSSDGFGGGGFGSGSFRQKGSDAHADISISFDEAVTGCDKVIHLQDQNVREALGYARNVAEVDNKFSNGLSTPANSLIPPIFKQFTSSSVKGYEKQDLDKANKLLDEDGWKLNKSTGYREKDGKELSLVYAARVGDANAETIAQNYIQQWKKIGVKVSLYNGKLMEFNSWVDHMTTPPGANDWDITDGSWSLASEPSQQDLFSAAAPYNFGHFNDSEITKDLNDIDSAKSENPTYRKAAFVKYQEDMNKKAYVIPTNFMLNYTPVNKRVVGMTLDYGAMNTWSEIGVSSAKLATK